jgi:hypothetical protein
MATTNRARGVGLLVNRILLYQPRYKVGLIGQVLTAESGRVKPHYKSVYRFGGMPSTYHVAGRPACLMHFYNKPEPFEL